MMAGARTLAQVIFVATLESIISHSILNNLSG